MTRDAEVPRCDVAALVPGVRAQPACNGVVRHRASPDDPAADSAVRLPRIDLAAEPTIADVIAEWIALVGAPITLLRANVARMASELRCGLDVRRGRTTRCGAPTRIPLA